MEAVCGRLNENAGGQAHGVEGEEEEAVAEEEAAAAGQAVRQVKSKQESVISGKQYFSPNSWPLALR